MTETPAVTRQSRLSKTYSLVIFGLIGMMAATFIMLNKQGADETTFHEYTIPLKKTLLDTLNSYLKRTDASLANAGLLLAKKDKDSANIRVRASRDTMLRSALQRDINLFGQLTDSGFAKGIAGKKIVVSRDTLDAFLNAPNDPKILKGKTLSATYLLDTGKGGLRIGVALQLALDKNGVHHSNSDVFRKYPEFALWVFLSIAQFTLWFIMIPVFIDYCVQMKARYQAGDLKPLTYAYILSFIVNVLFVIGFYTYVQDQFAIPHQLFMSVYVGRMVAYSAIGYLAATACFAGFLWASNLLTKTRNEYLAGVKNEEAAKMPDPSDKTRNDYDSLKQDLRFFFITASALLTIQVYWAGTLFHAINNTELFSMYKDFTGSPYLPYDLMYLFGAIHTLLLFIFYLPAKLQFLSPGFPKTDTTIGAQADSTDWPGLFKTYGKQLLEIAAASSPFLVSLLQGLFK